MFVLKNFEIGYNLPGGIGKRVGINNLRIYKMVLIFYLGQTRHLRSRNLLTAVFNIKSIAAKNY